MSNIGTLNELCRSYLYGGVRNDFVYLYNCVDLLRYANLRHTISSKVRSTDKAPFGMLLMSYQIVTFKKFGIGVKFVHGDDPAGFAAAIDENTKAIYVESIGNPKYNVAPIPELAKASSVNRRAPALVMISCGSSPGRP
jgi:hypothetical protein